ncbi:hypothetical protein FB451DRAFT_1521434 [Mycena latifolia]|nr:hypothetical protein FB451DRAFT_1521434 [Mycena latifolia]
MTSATHHRGRTPSGASRIIPFQVSPQRTRTFQPSPPRRSPPPDPDHIVDPQPLFRVFQPSPPRRSPSPDPGAPRYYMPGRPFQPSPPPRGTRLPGPDTATPASIQDIDPGYVALFCGLDVDCEHASVADAPRPQILPSPPSPAPEPPHKRQRRSTGCGARVHTGARAARHWRGSVSGACPAVVPLERAYFAPEAITHLDLHEKNCGCAIRGVGCRVWCVAAPPLIPARLLLLGLTSVFACSGNPLGALETRCAQHHSADRSTAYAFLPCAVASASAPCTSRSPAPHEHGAPSRRRRLVGHFGIER